MVKYNYLSVPKIIPQPKAVQLTRLNHKGNHQGGKAILGFCTFPNLCCPRLLPLQDPELLVLATHHPDRCFIATKIAMEPIYYMSKLGQAWYTVPSNHLPPPHKVLQN